MVFLSLRIFEILRQIYQGLNRTCVCGDICRSPCGAHHATRQFRKLLFEGCKRNTHAERSGLSMAELERERDRVTPLGGEPAKD